MVKSLSSTIWLLSGIALGALVGGNVCFFFMMPEPEKHTASVQSIDIKPEAIACPACNCPAQPGCPACPACPTLEQPCNCNCKCECPSSGSAAAAPPVATSPSVSLPSPSTTGAKPKKRKNLVLTMADGESYREESGVGARWLGRFVGSFRRVNEEADIVFFATSVAPTVSAMMGQLGMKHVQVGNEPSPYKEKEPALRRWWLMLEYLKEHEKEFPPDDESWVLAVDARDAFFQRDPFAFPHKPGDNFYAYLEELYTLQQSDWNSNIINECYQDEGGVQLIGRNPISCSGTVMGTVKAMRAYLGLMANESVVRDEAGVHKNRLPNRCKDMGGRDQGFHNWLLWAGPLDKVPGMKIRRFANEDGPVSTLQFGTLYKDRLGRVLNKNGEVVYIAHQIDRKFKDDEVAAMFPFYDNAMLPPGFDPNKNSFNGPY